MTTLPVHSRLAALREVKKLTLREMGKLLDLSHNAVSMFELGRMKIAPEKLRQYAKLLGLTPAEVEHEHLQAAFAYHARMLRETKAALTRHGSSPKKGRRAATL